MFFFLFSKYIIELSSLLEFILTIQHAFDIGPLWSFDIGSDKGPLI